MDALSTDRESPSVGTARLPTVIDGRTRIMAMLGDPIVQIKTPQAINPIFDALGERIVCIPIHVRAGDLEQVWAALKAIQNLVGFSVTIPHKRRAYELCDSIDQGAKRVGAVNVVRREANGEFRGYQFDGVGFVKGMESQGHVLAGRTCLLLGAGGAAAAIAYALVDAGVRSLRISNRSASKAEALCAAINDEFECNIARASDAVPMPGDLIVNATALGLNNEDPLPLDTMLLDDSMLVADVVAQPEVTRLLKAAEKMGSKTHSGIHMVENQVELIALHLARATQAAL